MQWTEVQQWEKKYQGEDSAVVIGVGVEKEKKRKQETRYKIQETAPVTGFVFCNSERGKMVIFRD